RGGEQVAAGAVAGCCWRRDMAGLVEERAGFADGVAGRGPADTQEAGQHVHRAQVPLVEDGQQAPLTVADLFVEDAAAGRGPGEAGGRMVAEAFGLGGLQGWEPLVSACRRVRLSPVSAGWASCSMIWARWGRASLSGKARSACAVGKRTAAVPVAQPWSSRTSRVSPTRSPMQVAVTSSRSASTFMEHACRW